MKSTIEATTIQIYQFLEANRISQDQLVSLWDNHYVESAQDNHKIHRNEIQKIYSTSGRKKLSSYYLNTLVTLLQDTFGFELEEEKIPRLGRRPLAAFAQLVGLILSISTLYIVIGGIATGQSSLTLIYGAPIWLTYTVLVATLLFLGALEGTQIAIVALTEKKVSLFKKRYPRGCKAIKLVNTKELIEKYLAGRQFGVIFVVFVIAQVTSFPQIEALPFTNFSIKALPTVINFLGFQLGLFGALLVLWVAQLLPQFIANKNPLLFLNLIGMNWVIRWCLWLEAIGPTRPASWLSAPQRNKLTVPTSSFVKHHDLADDVYGYEIVNQSHNWEIFEDQKWALDYTNAFRIRSNGFNILRDTSLLVHGEIGSAKFSNRLFRDGTQIQDELNTQGVEARPTGNGWSQFYQEVNSEEEFQKGDVIQNHYTLYGDKQADRAQTSIERPTKLITFNILLHDQNLKGNSVVIRKYRKDDVTGQAVILESKELSFTTTKLNSVRKSSFVDVHPKMNTVYELKWLNKSSGLLKEDHQNKIQLIINSNT